ncbi:histone-like nucleoid-structuring protein Lsr2 [Amycolatopsis jejuensis]|uniref:histone-like nucleoid-structuring protein Lsr2 n=1 Tax=Amycolatopsis jejuensis TaxID=330084 RepID=UPI00052761C9|nr:Lsr2 family protein [Amycolatopsis jejuensis]
MAQKVLVEMVDDLDGTDASQTVPFGLDGVQYEIDLSDANAAALRDEFATFIAAARRVGGRKTTVRGASTAPTAEDRERSKAIRAWAVDNGWAVAERGRIPGEVVSAYEESQKEEAAPRRKRGGKKATAK